MTTPSKLAIQIGAVSFSAEGDADWCERQLKAVLESMKATERAEGRTTAPSDFSETLANFLRAHTHHQRRMHS